MIYIVIALGIIALVIILIKARKMSEENENIYHSHYIPEDEEIADYEGDFFADSSFHDDCGDR